MLYTGEVLVHLVLVTGNTSCLSPKLEAVTIRSSDFCVRVAAIQYGIASNLLQLSMVAAIQYGIVIDFCV